MKHTLILTSIIGSILLSGCGPTLPTTSSPESTPATVKTGKTTLTGLLKPLTTKSGDATHSLTVKGKPPVMVNSLSVSLDDYNEKTVTLTGEFSGNTLFVDEVK